MNYSGKCCRHCIGQSRFLGIMATPWFGYTQLIKPDFSWGPNLFMIPIAIAPIIEHVGDVYTVNQVAKKDFIKSPGLHSTMLGDAIACYGNIHSLIFQYIPNPFNIIYKLIILFKRSNFHYKSLYFLIPIF